MPAKTNDTLSTSPLIIQTALVVDVDDKAITEAPSRRNFCLCSALLGLLVGILTQKNDFNFHLMSFLCRSLMSTVWTSALFAAATTIQLVIFLLLLRATVDAKERLYDLDSYFGTGSIVGVAVSWIGAVPGAEYMIAGVTCVSLACFHVLMWWFGAEMYDEDDKAEEENEKSEYQLLIV